VALYYNEIAIYFKRKDFLQSQVIEKELDNGSLIVSFEVSHDEDVDNIIKSWLPHIEVIEPKRYKNKIISELENYLKKVKETN
jgi:predicted DNA-binding transcriptional regulator YafY